jgi:hypothetical protein
MSKEDVFLFAQRKAFETLTKSEGVNEKFRVRPESVTIPAALIQEQALTNANGMMSFIFGSKSPIGTPVLNNIILGENDIAVVYGIQLLIGQGPTVNNRVYRSYGPAVQDNAPYNGVISIQLESNVPIANIDTLQFQKIDGTNRDQFDGAAVINPQRIITGRISTFNVQLQMNNIAASVFTPNLFVSMRLLIALGQAMSIN